MTHPKRTKMSAVDTAWLRMDRPQNLMMICGVLLFRERLSLARLRKVIGERFVVFKRFRQRPREMAGVTFWENDSAFRHRAARRERALPGRACRRELQHLRLAARDDATRSLAANGGSSTSSTTTEAAAH